MPSLETKETAWSYRQRCQWFMGQGNTQEIRHIQSKVLEPTCRQDEAAVSYQEGGEATPGNRGLTSSWLIGYQGKQGRSKSLIASWGRYFPAGWSHSGIRINWIIEKESEFQKTNKQTNPSTSTSLIMLKSLTVWIPTN